MESELQEMVRKLVRGTGRITVLTGAGISAESGIPTFRGPEGYWTVGAREYHPQEMATARMFKRRPDEVWQWYLYRMGVCARARPNPGHMALVEMEALLGDRFTLITQNVDNLHLRAGNRPERTFQIHGNVFFMRCRADCGPGVWPLPETVGAVEKGEPLSAEARRLLVCPRCGERSRPHVLWFDEVYDEEHFRFHSSLKVSAETRLLVVVGTSGTTNLPAQVVQTVRRNGGWIVDVNIEENPFSRLAENWERGFSIRQAGGRALPTLVDAMTG